MRLHMHYALASLLLPLAGASWAADGRATLERRGGSVQLTADDARPVAAAVQTLVDALALRITYEDPRYEFTGDLADVASSAARPRVTVPRGGRFVAKFPGSKDAGAMLERVLSAAAQAMPDLRFRIERSGEAWHVVPVGSRDARGRLVTRPSLLDARISLPDEERTAQQTIDAIRAAVSAANRVRVGAGAFSLDGGIVPVPGPPKFRFHAHDEPARAVLMRAFDAIEKERGVRLTSLLFYGPDGPEPGYVLNLVPVPDAPRN